METRGKRRSVSFEIGQESEWSHTYRVKITQAASVATKLTVAANKGCNTFAPDTDHF